MQLAMDDRLDEHSPACFLTHLTTGRQAAAACWPPGPSLLSPRPRPHPQTARSSLQGEVVEQQGTGEGW